MTGSIIFRGKSLKYWIDIIFEELINEFRDNDNLNLIFDKSKLLKISSEELTEAVKTIEYDENSIFSLKGGPFYIIPKKIKEKYPKGEDFNFEEFEDNEKDNIEIIDIQSHYNVYSAKYDPLETEKTIVEFQARKLLNSHAIIEDFSNFYIEGLPDIGEGSSIASGVVVRGDSRIGKNVRIFPNCYIENSVIGDDCEILPGSVIRDSILKGGNKIGPYAHLRFNTTVEKSANVGNFVEMKKSVFGPGSKAMHLSYIGDATVGKDVNIGAGTITCNYDGKKKNPTYIEDKSFVGSGTELIAPVTLGKNSYIAAGSTINEDVPEDSLAIARQKQRIIKEWSKRKKK